MDPQALSLATKTLGDAIDLLMSKGTPFVPIVVVQRGTERQLQRMTAGRGEDAAALAKQAAAAQTDADVAAFAVEGAIPYNGSRFDAIVVESWNFRTNKGARVGLRYELKGVLRKKAQLIGSPLHLGRGGWFDPEEGEPAAVPTFPEVAQRTPEPQPVPQPEAERRPVALNDFGPPPTTPAVAFDPPPGFEATPAPRPSPLDFPPPVLAPAVGDVPPPPAAPAPAAPAAAAPPAAVPVPDAPVPTYIPVPIQRNETPLGNRAMFAGVMEMATKNRSFPAFAIVQKAGEWEQVTMTDANLADTPVSVRAYARSRTDADFIAFAIDAFVTVNGADVTAVVVEVWEYSTRMSFSVAQRYVPTGDPPSPRLSGRPLMRTASGWVDVPSSMMLGGQVQFAYSEPGT